MPNSKHCIDAISFFDRNLWKVTPTFNKKDATKTTNFINVLQKHQAQGMQSIKRYENV